MPPTKRKRDALARLPRETELIPWATLGTHPTDEIAPDATTRALPDGRRPPLPGPLGSDVWVVLGREFNRRDADGWDPARESDRTVRLKFADLARAVGIGVSGESYALLTDTADRLTATVVRLREPETMEGSTLVERTTLAPLFHRVTYEKRTDVSTDLATNEVEFVLNEVIAWHWKHRYRLLDAGVNLALQGAGARRLHRLLDAQRFAVDHQGANPLALTMAWLVEKMPFATDKPAVARRALDRAHAELVDRGFLASADYEPPFTPGKRRGLSDIRVVYRFPEPAQAKGGHRSDAKVRAPGVDVVDRLRQVQDLLRDYARNREPLYASVVKDLSDDDFYRLLSETRQEGGPNPKAFLVKTAKQMLQRSGVKVTGAAADNRQLLRLL